MSTSNSNSNSIQVHVRLRPSRSSTLDGPHSPTSILLTPTTITVPNPSNPTTQSLKFSFDGCHGPETSQETIFEQVKPLVENVFRGVNSTVFCYGVTSSGKTYTMQGGVGVGTKEQGVIPRVVKTIFQKKNRMKKSQLTISFSYVQVYIDEIYDLLSTNSTTNSSTNSNSNPSSSSTAATTAKKLDIRTTSTGSNIIADLTTQPLTSIQEFKDLFGRANKNRKVAATNLNEGSSRSHAILSVYVETKEVDSGKTYLGKICLVDLAGSEDNNLTGNDPLRMRESSSINKSLTNLGNVVDALNKQSGRIPYRDSKLTRILQDALGGTAMGMLILNLAPGEKYAKDTLRTLKFATRTREVENRVVCNERETRPIPQPHFSHGPTRAGALQEIKQTPTASYQTHAQAGPSRVVKPLVNRINNGTVHHNHNQNQNSAGPSRLGVASSSIGQSVRDGFNGAGKGKSSSTSTSTTATAVQISEEQLNARIENMVRQVWEEKQNQLKGKGKIETEAETELKIPEDVANEVKIRSGKGKEKGSSSQKLPEDQQMNEAELDEDEKKDRARVLIKLARQHQDSNDLDNAIKYYKQARVYVPENKKLSTRIVELELALEGHVPVPLRSGHPQLPSSSTNHLKYQTSNVLELLYNPSQRSRIASEAT